MPIDLSRHPINMEISRKQVQHKEELIALCAKACIENPDRLNQCFLAAYDLLNYLIITNSTDTIKINNAFKAAMEGITAIFKLATASKGAIVDITIGNKQAQVISKGEDTTGANIMNWREGFYLAIISRSFTTVDLLCTVPINMMRRSAVTTDESIYLYANALQALWKKDSNAAELLEKAVDATNPEKIKLGLQDYILSILVPELELIWRFAIRDTENFNNSLKYALENHKKYWSKKRRLLAAAGFIALGPLAIISLAYDANIPIEVESDYLPKEFYKGKYTTNA